MTAYSTFFVKNNGFAGGTIGDVTSCGEVKISECVNKGDITGWHKFVGGVAGGIYRGTLENCYNTGNISAVGDNKCTATWDASLAGLIGVTYKYVAYSSVADPRYDPTGPLGAFSIINCYNGGAIDGTKLAANYGQTYPLYGKLVYHGSQNIVTCSPEAPEKEENCYSYDDVAENKVTAEVMGSAFKADADNIQAGLPLLNWEESSVSDETYNVTFEVKNAAGEAVQGAAVRVYTKSDMSDDSEVKAEDGVLALRSGTYYYKATADGYVDTNSSFKVDGKEAVITITMQKEALATFNVKPASATFTLTDSAKAEVTPISAGDGVYKYSLVAGS